MKKTSIIFIFLLTSFIMPQISYCEDEIEYLSEQTAQKEIFGHPDIMTTTLEKYINIASKKQNSYTANWKISELAYYISEYYMFKHNIYLTEKYLTLGVKYAKKSTKINPNGIEGKYWLIANLALYSDIKGPSKMIAEVIIEAKKTMENISSLDKEMKYMNGGWGRYIGRFYISMPSPPQSFGDSKKGVAILEDVRKKYPTLTNINVLAQGYMVRGQLIKAKQLLNGNLNSITNIDTSSYINRRDISFTKTLLELTKKAIRLNKNAISISDILKIKYNYSLNLN